MKHVALTYGRLNCPTKAHEHVYHRLLSLKGAKVFVFVSTKTGDPKNPLTIDQKLPFIKKMFPAATVEGVTGGYIEAFKKVSPADKLTIVVGGDRVDVVKTLANKYNHKEYEFGEIEVVNAGSRQHDTMSATKMRNWALEGDKENFFKGCSDKLSDKDKEKLYSLTREALLKMKK